MLTDVCYCSSWNRPSSISNRIGGVLMKILLTKEKTSPVIIEKQDLIWIYEKWEMLVLWGQ